MFIVVDKFRFQFESDTEGSQNPEKILKDGLWKKGMSMSYRPVISSRYYQSSKIVSFKRIQEDVSFYEVKDDNGNEYHLIID